MADRSARSWEARRPRPSTRDYLPELRASYTVGVGLRLFLPGYQRHDYAELPQLEAALNIGDLLNRLEKAKRLHENDYLACCPAHADRTPSLHVSQKNGTLLVKCQAGCDTADVMKALGLTMSDLSSSKPVEKTSSKIVASYDYLDEEGNILFQVVRYDPKSFRQRKPDGKGGFDWNMDGVRRVLYHLPDVMKAETIYIVEGEKDADNLRLCLREATTSPGGANAWKPEYADCLKGKKVVILPDRDAPGYAYAKQVAKSLQGKARQLKVVILPAGKDVSEWLELGGDPASLDSLEQDITALWEQEKVEYRTSDDAIVWNYQGGQRPMQFRAENLKEERTGIHSRIFIFSGELQLGWDYLNVERRDDRSALAGAAYSLLKGEEGYTKDELRYDLDRFCAGLWHYHLSKFQPEHLAGDAEPMPLTYALRPYVLKDGGTILFAPPGRGKSWTALLWAVSVDAGCSRFWAVEQMPVLFINLERSARSVSRRLGMVNRVLGLPPERPLFTLNARGRSLVDVAGACRRAIAEHSIGMVLLDSISRTGLGDLNENLSGNRIADTLSSLCPTWIALGHTSRGAEDHLFGTVMQDAAADIIVRLECEPEGNNLGVSWEIVKANDAPFARQDRWVLEFGEDTGLVGLRMPGEHEFEGLKMKDRRPMIDTVKEFILDQESSDATATQISDATGFNRSKVSTLLSGSSLFKQTRRVKMSVYYGVVQP